MNAGSQANDGRRWTTALVVALLMHLGALWSLDAFELWTPHLLEASELEPISFVFENPPPPRPEEKRQPDVFSELPEDRADVRPEKADFLSNVDSRARDSRPGGEDGELPQLRGRSEAPHVGMRPLSGAPAPAAAAASKAAPPPQDAPAETNALDPATDSASAHPTLAPSTRTRNERPSAASSPQPTQPETQPSSPARAVASADPTRELLRQRPSVTPELELLRRPGVTDLFQEEMHHPGGNVALFGDVSLNTLAWDYAPWLQRFARDFRRNWRAPYAYYLGLIHGWTLVKLVIAPSGELVELELLGEEGHASLGQASVASLRATAPFQPLPADFPEDALVLQVKLLYPDWHR